MTCEGSDHDYEHVTCPRRAVFICPRCGEDISLEYLFWAQAAHPEWFEVKDPDWDKLQEQA